MSPVEKFMLHPDSGKFLVTDGGFAVHEDCCCGEVEPGEDCECCEGTTPLRFTVDIDAVLRCDTEIAPVQAVYDWINNNLHVVTQTADPDYWEKVEVVEYHTMHVVVICIAAGTPSTWGLRVFSGPGEDSPSGYFAYYEDTFDSAVLCADGKDDTSNELSCDGVVAMGYDGTGTITPGP